MLSLDMHATKSNMINTKEIFERFVSETVSTAVFGDISRAIQLLHVVKYIENDSISLKGSIKSLMNSMIKRIYIKIFRQEIYDFFKKGEMPLINATLSKGDGNKKQTLSVKRGGSLETDDEIFDQFLIFFGGR